MFSYVVPGTRVPFFYCIAVDRMPVRLTASVAAYPAAIYTLHVSLLRLVAFGAKRKSLLLLRKIGWLTCRRSCRGPASARR